MAKFKQKFEQTDSNQPKTPEQQLWISVLTKAADDAIYTSDWLEARKAIAWFRSNNKEFKEDRDILVLYERLYNKCIIKKIKPKYLFQGGTGDLSRL